jgi:glycosyltransferase involved in cell wall biosynthesis
MKIVVDATPLLLRSAGVKTYTYNWLRYMRRFSGEDTVLAWPYLDVGEKYSHEKSIVGRWGTLARLALLQSANYSALPLLDWLGPRADVFHASNQLRNPPRRCRLTATLYDMTCWLVPETHHPRNVRGSLLFAERVMRRADGLIAISESTRNDAVRILGFPAAKIEVIYPGIEETYFEATPDDARRAAAKYGLSKPYVLFVGTVEPRKNIDALLDGWKLLAPALREEFDLVAAGPSGWGDTRTLKRLRAGDAGVKYLGYVPEQDLPGITAGAAVFVYPSLYEGFGLPLGQAMAAGVPAVTSKVSSMPEVVGDAGMLVDPRSPAEIRGALGRLLESRDLREALASRARSRARQYRWEVCARQSLEYFHKLAG